MFNFVGRLSVTHPWKVCLAWVVVGALLAVVAPAWDSKAQDDDIRFLPARCPSVQGYARLEEAFPQDVYASRAVFAVERPGAALTDADFALVDRFVAELEKLRQEEPALQIGRVHSHRDPFFGSRLVSADRQCTLIQVSLGSPYLALQTQATVDRAEARLRQILEESGDAPRLLTTGAAGVGRDLIAASGDSLHDTTLATIALVVIILLLVHRAPLLALVPLATIAGSVWVSLKILALMTLIPGFYLVNVSKVFAIVILYGAGTDYCLFLISRYREELAGGHDLRSALARSVGAVGGALAASAATVVCGLGLMGLAEFAKVRCAGPAIGLSLAVALVASLTLAPALLQLLGATVFWPGRLPTRAGRSPRRDWWERVSRRVVAHPKYVWAAAVLLLAPLALLGCRVRPNYKPTGELAPTSGSIQGLAAIQRHFRAGETGPLTVLLESSADWDAPEGRAVVSQLSRGFANLENVAEVRSLTQPLGVPLAEQFRDAPDGNRLLGGLFQSMRRQAERAAREFYLTTLPAGEGTKPRHVTRLDVVFESDPFDAESTATLDRIEYWLKEELPRSARRLGPVETACYGVTVGARDLAQVTESDRLRVNVLVLAGIFLILLVVVRKPWLAGYLLLTVLFSYYATLGATALAGTLWNGRPLGEVDWRVPFFLFTILVAVGEDYNILLMTRALRERKRHGDDEGMRRALARTGGTITSCGLIMAGTFATLMLGELGTLKQIGFALAFGVLLDTFVVRPFLVPAFTLLVWRFARGRDEAPPEPLRRAA